MSKNSIHICILCLRQIIAICFSVIALNASAQTYYFDTYGAVEGASSKIYCIFQDNNQYVWLGTPGGVSRFDGNSLENFSSENGLAIQAVRTIFQDYQNNIWFGHAGGGISVYRNKTFKSFTLLDSLINGDITSIFEDHEKKLWLTTASSGAFVITNPLAHENISYIQYIGKDNLSDRVYSYCIGRDSTIYLITDVGIRIYNRKIKAFSVFNPPGLTNYFNIITMSADREDNLWFGTYNGGLYKYIRSLDTIMVYDVRDGLSSNWISRIAQDKNGDIWVGTWGGGITKISNSDLYVYNTENGLNAKYIFDLIEDAEGNILIGSSNKGLSIFKGDDFVNYGRKHGLLNTEVNAIVKATEDNYWFGTNNGIYVFNSGKNKVIKSYNEDSFLKGATSAYISDKVTFLKKDMADNIWIGTQNQGVLFYDSKTKQILSALDINKNFVGSVRLVSSLDISNNNHLWIGTPDGLINYNITTGETIRLSNANGLIGNSITTVYSDHLNQTWIGAAVKEGITKIEDDHSLTTYKFSIAITPSCMVMDNDSTLWIGTQGQGIILFKEDTIINRIDQSNGLLSNLINTLNVDSNNRIYIGTNKGLNIYDKNNSKILTYGAKNGFVGIETNPSASYPAPDGKMWFGTHKGVNVLDTRKMGYEYSEPHVYLTDMIVNQERIPILQNRKLKHKQNHISFRYKSICLRNPEAVRYRIMLDGVDSDWQEVTKQDYITYQTLPPKKYTFKVKARNSYGEWNKEPIIYKFQILPPIYFRWYFVLSVIIILLIGFRIYISLRERQLLKEKKELEEKVLERTIELSNANAELATKNKDITDSIIYAQRIQMAILPPEIPFSEVFVLFKPKDIVSGDFYWITKKDNLEFMAAVDCTGHGVPGAFISFIGYSSLNKVVKEKNIYQPSEILNNLNEAVEIALNLESEEAIRDGMDLAFTCYNPQSQTLQYSGAFNSLYLIRNSELIETKADRFSIGKSLNENKRFTNHSVKIEKGDTIYIFSDGYADQFGGEDHKKFKTGKMKKLLISIQDKPMDKQKEILDNTIEQWRGETEQIDDILIIGRRFN